MSGRWLAATLLKFRRHVLFFNQRMKKMLMGWVWLREEEEEEDLAGVRVC